MKDKILIFGNGQIGNLYLDYFIKEGIDVKIAEEADIRKIEDIEEAVKEYSPTVVINTAAETNLEWCQNNRLEAFHVNVLGADNIAQLCDREKIYFIHFSSGCILESKDENDQKTEDSTPNPVSYYSWLKAWGEQLIKFQKSLDFKYLILRPRQPVSAQVNYKNMLVKFLTFTRFIDIPNNGTVLEDLMEWTKMLIEKRATGTLHVANEGWTTPYEISLMIKKHILPRLEPIKITKEELNKMTPNKRVDTVLNVDKLKSFGAEVRPYKERLKEIIVQLGENIKKMDKATLKKELETALSFTKQRTIPNDVWEDLLK